MDAFVLQHVEGDRCMILAGRGDDRHPLLEVGRMVADALARNGVALWADRHPGLVGRPGIVLIERPEDVAVQIRADVGDPTTIIACSIASRKTMADILPQSETAPVQWTEKEKRR